jgi:hypothetical protein
VLKAIEVKGEINLGLAMRGLGLNHHCIDVEGNGLFYGEHGQS